MKRKKGKSRNTISNLFSFSRFTFRKIFPCVGVKSTTTLNGKADQKIGLARGRESFAFVSSTTVFENTGENIYGNFETVGTKQWTVIRSDQIFGYCPTGIFALSDFLLGYFSIPLAPKRPLCPPLFDSPALPQPLSSRGCPFGEGLAGRLAKYLLVITSKKGVFHSWSWNNRIPTFAGAQADFPLSAMRRYYIQRCFLVEPEAAWPRYCPRASQKFLRYENTSLPHPTTWNNNVTGILCHRFGNLHFAPIFPSFPSSHPRDSMFVALQLFLLLTNLYLLFARLRGWCGLIIDASIVTNHIPEIYFHKLFR